MKLNSVFMIGVFSILGISCGTKDISETKIIGGDPATEFAYPFMVDHNISNGRHWCGGSVVGPRSVLSAAHCFSRNGPRSSEYLLLGSHNRRVVDENEVRVEIESLSFHPSFDLVLITTKEPIDTEKYKPIPLATQRPEVGEPVKVVGWGSTEGTGDNTILQEVEIPVVSNQSCRSAYSGVRNHHICAGGSLDSCGGDSGGPLFSEDEEGGFTLVGVVSFGDSPCRGSRPGVYVSIPESLDWISKNIRQ